MSQRKVPLYHARCYTTSHQLQLLRPSVQRIRLRWPSTRSWKHRAYRLCEGYIHVLRSEKNSRQRVFVFRVLIIVVLLAATAPQTFFAICSWLPKPAREEVVANQRTEILVLTAWSIFSGAWYLLPPINHVNKLSSPSETQLSRLGKRHHLNIDLNT